MLPKPSECVGCPLFHEAKPFHFVGDDVPSSARVVLIYDRPDSRNTASSAGDTAEAQSFREAFSHSLGLETYEVGYAHLIRCKTQPGLIGAKLAQAKEHCRVYDKWHEGQTLITLGADSWRFFSDNIGGSRGDWRGYFVEAKGFVVFCMFGMLDFWKDDRYKKFSEWDWGKIKRYLAGKWPVKSEGHITFTGEFTGDERTEQERKYEAFMLAHG